MSDEIPTVALLQGSFGRTVDEAWVDYGQTAVYGMTAPIGSESEFELPLLGMKPGSEYHFRIGARIGGELLYGDDNLLETPDGIPSGLPTVEVTAGSSSGMYLAISTLTTETGYVAIIDPDGDFVWWWKHPLFGLENSCVPRAYLSPDGESLTFMTIGSLTGGETQISRVRLDGTNYEDVAEVETGHHDFVELPDGTVAVLREDLIQFDGHDVAGDALVEFAPDGSESIAFSVWDFIDYDPDRKVLSGISYTHCNAIDYIPEEDAYWVSVNSFDQLWKVDRAEKQLLWKVGGEDSDFVLEDGSTAFSARQHQFEVQEEGVLIFDNGRPDVGAYSRAVEYRLDPDSGQAEEVWSYRRDPDIYVLGYGDVTRFDDGSTLVNWGSAGVLEGVSAEGETLWEFSATLGSGFGYTEVLPSLYPEP